MTCSHLHLIPCELQFEKVWSIYHALTCCAPTQETTSTPPLIVSDSTKNIKFWGSKSFFYYIQYKRYVNDHLYESAPENSAFRERLQYYTSDAAVVLQIDNERQIKMHFIRLASVGKSGQLTDQNDLLSLYPCLKFKMRWDQVIQGWDVAIILV